MTTDWRIISDVDVSAPNKIRVEAGVYTVEIDSPSWPKSNELAHHVAALVCAKDESVRAHKTARRVSERLGEIESSLREVEKLSHGLLAELLPEEEP